LAGTMDASESFDFFFVIPIYTISGDLGLPLQKKLTKFPSHDKCTKTGKN
jgi:hypothetical protein